VTEKNGEEIKRVVRERYADLARQHAQSCCAPSGEDASSCCSATSAQTARAQRLYSGEELESVAENIPSLGCGNPIALAELRENETVLDLGSGGGLDCFLAAQRVGPHGNVIGLDMTPDMLQLARLNAEKLSLDNVEFRLGEMEHMPVETDSVDVVISNCVVNLSPDKDAVFREVFRVLKPGGRLCVSDIVTRGELPAHIRDNLEQWACCIGGALDEQDYLERIRTTGFVQLEVAGEGPSTAAGESGCCGGDSYLSKIASITVKAIKPR
jgi:SAM-dependent methyltransferase